MAVDGGAAGLQNSRHHPNAGTSATNAQTPLESNKEKTGEDIRTEWEKTKASLIGKGWKGGERWREEVSERFEEIDAAMTRLLSDLEAYTLKVTATREPRESGGREKESSESYAKLCRDVEEIKATLQGLPKATPADGATKTYAQAASATRHRTETRTPTMIIPARREREVVVRARDLPAELARRTPQETVKAVNTQLGREEAVASRRLPSGDVVLTFSKDARQYKDGQGWIKSAFGDSAEIARRELQVLVKGVPTKLLRDAGAAKTDITAELNKANRTIEITRATPRLPRDPQARYAAVLLSVRSSSEAIRMCAEGLIWEASIYRCEPFSRDAAVVRCFKCQGFGHVAHYCVKRATCPHCAQAAHEEGDKACPASAPSSTLKRCINCKGRHASFDSRCPTAKAAHEAAKEAYHHRPLQFARSAAAPPPPRISFSATPPTRTTDNDGFTEVTKKRKTASSRLSVGGGPLPRGRPPFTAYPPRNGATMDAFLERRASAPPTQDSSNDNTSTW